MATAGNIERCFVRKIRQYAAGNHMTFAFKPALLSSLPNITILPKTKTAGEGKMESFFARKTRRHVLVCQQYDANLLLYCYLRLAEKSSRL